MTACCVRAGVCVWWQEGEGFDGAVSHVQGRDTTTERNDAVSISELLEEEVVVRNIGAGHARQRGGRRAAAQRGASLRNAMSTPCTQASVSPLSRTRLTCSLDDVKARVAARALGRTPTVGGAASKRCESHTRLVSTYSE